MNQRLCSLLVLSAPLVTVNAIRPFYFDGAGLKAVGQRLSARYASAQPFPHAVIDDLLPDWVIDEVLAEFPAPDSDGWRRYGGSTEVKLELTRPEQFGPFTRHVLTQFNSAEFVEFLEALTCIGGIVPDPHFEGGGLHQIERGGYLSVHADFNQHPRLNLDRRLNVLLYLNRDWREEYGGHLELWDRDMSRSVQRILPVANRCVIFATTSFSYHGHPDPLECPEGMTRKSMAFYYYTNGRPQDEISVADHSTLFRPRPNDRNERLRLAVQRWVPPVLDDAYRSIKRRHG